MEGWTSTRVLRPDDTSLFVTSAGAPGPSGFLLCDGVGCDGFAWRYLAPTLCERGPVVHPHYRGHGQSSLAGGVPRDRYEPGAGDGYAIPTLAEDLLAALDAANVERAVVIGHSMGVQVALEVALTAPERVSGLVLVCGSYGRPLDTVGDTDTLRRTLPLIRAFAERFAGPITEIVSRVLPTELAWQIARLFAVDGRLMQREDLIAYLQHMASIDPRVFLETLDEAGKHTTEDRLSQIRVPTLVVGGELDAFTPYWVSEVMARRIEGAELHMIRGGTHTATLEQHELFGRLVVDFLARNGLP